MDNIQEFAQVSIVRYEEMFTENKLLALRIQELEDHIDELERFLLYACKDAKYDWVSIEIKDIKRLIYKEDE